MTMDKYCIIVCHSGTQHTTIITNTHKRITVLSKLRKRRVRVYATYHGNNVNDLLKQHGHLSHFTTVYLYFGNIIKQRMNTDVFRVYKYASVKNVWFTV